MTEALHPEPGPAVDVTAWFTDAYAVHRTGLHRYLRHLGADQHTAHDILAEAMTRVWRRAQAGRVPDDPGAYLRRVVRNAYVDHWRRSRTQEQPGSDATAPARPDHAIDHWVGVEHVREAVSRLRRRDRQILTLASYGLTPADITDQLGLPSVNATTVALHRARLALRRELDG